MADIASLVIKVTTNGVDSASASLGKLGKAAVAAGTAIGGLATAKQVFDSLVASQRNFDKLNAGLVTMTGSTENAAKAFSILQQFAKDTPYGLNQAVEGFTKLVALGLNPSKEALISYGNTAAAMGKDLNQMIEAVADAATGEFERLKEFGIKASQQGDNVSFTFRGVTTTVKKNSEEIQKYLLNIGNTDFAGAMEARANSLDGVLSSLEDTFDGLVLNIAQSGFGDALAEQAKIAENAIQSLSDAIASGELIGAIRDWRDLFDDSFKFISDALNDLAFDTEGRSNDMADSLMAIPDAIRDWLPEIQQTFHDIIAWFQRIDDYAVALGQSLVDVFDVSKTASLTYKNMTAEADKAYAASLAASKAEADGIRERSALRQKEIAEQRRQYEERRNQETKLQDLVGKPGANTGGTTGGTSASADKAAKAAAKRLEQQKKAAQDFLDTLARQNQDEFKAIDAQEQQKLAKLAEFNKAGLLSQQEYEDAKTQIMQDADTQRNELLTKQTEERMNDQKSADAYIAQLQSSFEGEAAELDRQYAIKQEKLDEFHKKGLVSEEEYQNAKIELQKQKNEESLQADLSTWEQIASNVAAASDENTAVYKAAAITQSVISTYLAATKALAEGGPILGPILAATVVAAGLANVAKIRSAREQGGTLSAGQASTIAERGKPEVIMPASASRVRTAQQMRQIMGENGNKQDSSDSVVIVNQTTGRIDQASTERDDEGRLRVIIRETVSGDLQDSNSQISLSRRNTRNQPGF